MKIRHWIALALAGIAAVAATVGRDEVALPLIIAAVLVLLTTLR